MVYFAQYADKIHTRTQNSLQNTHEKYLKKWQQNENIFKI